MSHVFSHQVQFVRDLASAIGLDPDENHITCITLEAEIKSPPKVTVQMILDTDQDSKVSSVIKRYQLESHLESVTSNDGS